MKAIVIGAKGFLGSYIYNYFVKKAGYDTWACDVMVDYVSPRYVQIDATNSDFATLFTGTIFDICINCSGAASVPDSLIHPQRDFLLNTFNVFRLLDAIRLYNPVCKFINISSAAVYGNPTNLPIKESAILCPVSPYGHHKVMTETICKEFLDFFGIGTCSLRIFSAYGEGLKKQILWDVLHKMKNGPQIQLFGNGYETRDFINIRDIASIIDLVIDKAKFQGESINVANGEETQIKDLVELAGKLMNWEGQIDFTVKIRQGDPSNWRADISLIESFGYKSSISLEEGLSKYARWVSESI